MEFVWFEVLVQVLGEELVGYARVAAEYEGAFYADDVVLGLGAVCGQLEDLDLDFGLFG